MKLATLDNGSPDGQLALVSRDHSRGLPVPHVAATLQEALTTSRTTAEELLLAAGRLAERGVRPAFLSSVVRAASGEPMNVPEVDRRRNALAYENWPDLLEYGMMPIIRTAPDHGTAFDIAGQDKAHPGAMIAAIRTAGECARRLSETA